MNLISVSGRPKTALTILGVVAGRILSAILNEIKPYYRPRTAKTATVNPGVAEKIKKEVAETPTPRGVGGRRPGPARMPGGFVALGINQDRRAKQCRKWRASSPNFRSRL